MKNNKRKFMILSIIAALALSSTVGCGDGKKKDSSSDNSTTSTTVDPEKFIKQPVQFYFPTDSLEENATKSALEAEDPTAPNDGSDTETDPEDTDNNNSSEPATKYINVTEANGQPATIFVDATEANGEKVTNSNGETVTQSVQATTAVVDENSNNNNNNNVDSSNYVPYMQESWAQWMDISKDEDYIFNGEFIEVTFKVKDNTPDGVYDVQITNPDFANYYKGGTEVIPDTVVDGKVYVNKDLEPQREFTDSDGFAVYGDHVAVKQGDEVKFLFYMNNNPGLVAMSFIFEYDRNAMDIVSCKTAGEFAEIADTLFSNSN